MVYNSNYHFVLKLNLPIICRAQTFYHENIFAMIFAKLLGLLSVLAVPSILKVLMHTNESGTQMTAYRRYLATIFHTMSWYDEELVEGSRYKEKIYRFTYFLNIISTNRKIMEITGSRSKTACSC